MKSLNFVINFIRFDPVTNVWEYVGDLPEPRHHHSVTFLRGRVYLVGTFFSEDSYLEYEVKKLKGKSLNVNCPKRWYTLARH